MMSLTDAARWEAVANNDASYDGVFYYGVRTTGIFCRPSCRSKLPNRGNVVYFDSPGAAEAAGFRSCKRCRPELLHLPADAVLEIGEAVELILTGEYGTFDILEALPLRVGVSPFHLQRTFKKFKGMTPKAFLQRLRIEKAGMHLKENRLSNTDICYLVGFSSLSSFYAAFRAETGASPREYRRNYSEMQRGSINEYCI